MDIQNLTDSRNVKPHYIIKLLAFLNARHYVVLGDRHSPVHAHSWQLKVDVWVPSDNPQQIAFGDILEKIKYSLDPYENSLLNEKTPFDTIMPTTENIAGVLFNKIDREISHLGVKLNKISIWESPTKGIEVTAASFDLNSGRNSYHQAMDSGEKIDMDVKAETAVQNEGISYINDNNCHETGIIPGTDKQAIATTGFPRYKLINYLISAFIILSTLFLAYHNILVFPENRFYPWGSDTWGHLYKADYLSEQIKLGNFYPKFTSDWYNGTEIFRYWGPVSYYIIAALKYLTGNIFTAGHYYIIICAAAGSLSWLLFAGRMGLVAATLGGIFWIMWPDNIRVALSEGNLPRLISTALLPLLFYCFWRTLENINKKYWILTILLIHLLIICHPMFGALLCICLAAFGCFLFVFKGCPLSGLIRGFLGLASGIVTSSWWLIPALTGGITGIEAGAVAKSAVFVPAMVSFNPAARIDSSDIFYWGASLLLFLAGTLIFWKNKEPWQKSLFICGVLIIAFTFPAAQNIHSLLPLGQLIWPTRFSSFAGMAIMASAFSFTSNMSLKPKIRILMGSIFLVFLIDSYFSLYLIHAVSKPASIVEQAEALKNTPGWKVATMDLSLSGSAPSFYFSNYSKREQLYGWSYQGAVTARNIMLLNTALEKGYYDYLFRGLTYLGATDILFKTGLVKDKNSLANASLNTQYKAVSEKNGTWYWHGDNRPYMLEAQDQCLAIGRHAALLSVIIPGVEVGGSQFIDSYSIEELQKYPVLILAGFKWHNREKAEELVKDLAGRGKRILVDMTDLPRKVLAKQPYFLGIYGESVDLKNHFTLYRDGQAVDLSPFSNEFEVWKCYVPQGLDGLIYSFKHYGRDAAILGYKEVDNEKIYFLGGNLIYHTFLTRDPYGLEILKYATGLQSIKSNINTIPINNYSVTNDGYIIKYNLNQDMDVILPIAALDGFKVIIDGAISRHSTFENLIRVRLPAGSHAVEIKLMETGVHYIGKIVTALSAPLIILYLVFLRLGRKKNEAAEI